MSNCEILSVIAFALFFLVHICLICTFFLKVITYKEQKSAKVEARSGRERN